MKTIGNRWICGCCLASLATVFGVSAGTADPAAVAPEKTLQGCVWKLSDGDNTVYLAGSVHLLRESDLPLPKAFDIAYEDCAELVFEIDMALLSGPEAAAAMTKLGIYSQGDNLANHLSQDTYASLQEYFLSRRVPAATLNRMKPGLVLLTISSLEAIRLGARADLGLETQYYQRSIVDGKPSRGLETIEYQLSRFDELGEKEVDRLLRETMEEIEEMPEMIEGLIDAWRSGDTEDLDELLNEQLGEEDRVRKLLLTDRNRNWVPHIEKALAGDRNVLFIVGAAHLVGKESVIDLLRKKGYRVEKWKEHRPQAIPARRKAA